MLTFGPSAPSDAAEPGGAPTRAARPPAPVPNPVPHSMALRLILLAAAFLGAAAFVPGKATNARVALRMGADSVNPAVRERIEGMLENKVMLFMKGSKIFPQCGFSNTAVQVLNAVGAPFETFDVLSDPDIRQGIKEFSDWPTIPQLYVDKEFVGGSDIIIEMYQSGELQEMIEVASAS